MKFSHNVRDSSYFPTTPFPDCLCHASFSRYSPLSLEVVEKPNKCKSSLVPNFFREGRPNFLRHVVSTTYHPPFGKVWLCSICWSLSAKPGNEMKWNAEITEGGWKCSLWLLYCNKRVCISPPTTMSGGLNIVNTIHRKTICTCIKNCFNCT